jgi:glycosyltransferase involved in cell wall biosynthesis
MVELMRVKPRVLISAYACEPGKGSEPEVGWRVSTEMAKCCEVRVVTRSNNRILIEAGLAGYNGPHPEVVYYDLPAWCRWLKRRGLGVAGYYLFWQIGVRRMVRRQARWHDLIHHVTFNGLQLPGCWRHETTPVVLGPLGGGMTCPKGYLPLFGAKERGEALRGFLVKHLHWLPWWRGILADAAVVLAANQESAELIRPLRSGPVPIMLETAISRDAVVVPSIAKPANGPLRLLWLGNLIPRKAAVLAIEAMAKAVTVNQDLELVIAGSGPEEETLRARVGALNLGGRIQFIGKVPKAEVNSLMDQADAFLFTSVRDTSGNVVLEAMSRGLPVIAIRHQGVREICDDTSALLVEPASIDATIDGLAQAILRLRESPALRQRLGAAALQRVRDHFTWDCFRERMLNVYYEALKA